MLLHNQTYFWNARSCHRFLSVLAQASVHTRGSPTRRQNIVSVLLHHCLQRFWSFCVCALSQSVCADNSLTLACPDATVCSDYLIWQISNYFFCPEFFFNWGYIFMQRFLHFTQFNHILSIAEVTLFKNVSYTFLSTRILITNYNRLCSDLIAVWTCHPGRPMNTLETCRAISDTFNNYYSPLQRCETHLCVCLQWH